MKRENSAKEIKKSSTIGMPLSIIKSVLFLASTVCLLVKLSAQLYTRQKSSGSNTYPPTVASQE